MSNLNTNSVSQQNAEKMKMDVVNWTSWPPEIAKNLKGGLKDPLEVHNKTKGCLETAIIDDWEAIDDSTTVIWWRTADGKKKNLYTPMTQPEEIYKRYEELCPKNEIGDKAAPKIRDILPDPKKWDTCGLAKEEILLRWLSLTAYLNEYDEKGCNVGYVFSSSNKKWFCATHWKVNEPNELHFEVFFNVENNSGQLHHKGLYIARGEFRPLPVVYEVIPGEEKTPDTDPPIAGKQGMLTTTKWPGVFEYETPSGEKFPINFYYINYRCKNDAHEKGNSNEKQNIIYLLKEALKPMETENRGDETNRTRQQAHKATPLAPGGGTTDKRDVILNNQRVGIPAQHPTVRHAVAVPQATVGQPAPNNVPQSTQAQAAARLQQMAAAQQQQLQALANHYHQLYAPQVQAGQIDATTAYQMAMAQAQQHFMAAQQQAAAQQHAARMQQLGQFAGHQISQMPSKYPPHSMQPGVNGQNQPNAQQGNQADILHQPNLATAQAAAQAGYYQQTPMMVGYMPGVQQYPHTGIQFPQPGRSGSTNE